MLNCQLCPLVFSPLSNWYDVASRLWLMLSHNLSWNRKDDQGNDKLTFCFQVLTWLVQQSHFREMLMLMLMTARLLIGLKKKTSCWWLRYRRRNGLMPTIEFRIPWNSRIHYFVGNAEKWWNFLTLNTSDWVFFIRLKPLNLMTNLMFLNKLYIFPRVFSFFCVRGWRELDYIDDWRNKFISFLLS